jgi:Ca2+/Na+ antiporter
VFSAIIFHQNVYYIKIADIKYARQGGAMAPGLNAVHPMTLVFTIFFMWSVPVWHFVLMVLVYIMLLYYAFKRSSRIAALKMAAQQEISKNPTPLNG